MAKQFYNLLMFDLHLLNLTTCCILTSFIDDLAEDSRAKFGPAASGIEHCKVAPPWPHPRTLIMGPGGLPRGTVTPIIDEASGAPTAGGKHCPSGVVANKS